MFWMTFFILNGRASRTEPLGSFAEALEAARKGSSGAKFFITFFGDDPDDDVQILEDLVP